MCYSAMVEQDVQRLAKRFGAEAVVADWNAFEALRANSADHLTPSKATPTPPLTDRIYPGYFAPILTMTDNKPTLRLMRYSVEPPEWIATSKNYTSFNARRDNLRSAFWSESFQKHHGILVLKGFFEWVAVKDVIQAGRISLEEVKAQFEHQKLARKQRLKELKKPYSPTKAELTSPLLRKVVIQFSALGEQELLVPVIYSLRTPPGGHTRMGFAMVTDDPPPEVAAAGHDRCPVILSADAAERWWRQGPTLSVGQIAEILDQKPSLNFGHTLTAAG